MDAVPSKHMIAETSWWESTQVVSSWPLDHIHMEH